MDTMAVERRLRASLLRLKTFDGARMHLEALVSDGGPPVPRKTLETAWEVLLRQGHVYQRGFDWELSQQGLMEAVTEAIDGILARLDALGA